MNSKRYSITISAIISIIFLAVLLSSILFINNQLLWIFAMVFAVLIFAINYFLYNQYINKYINEKINLIYKTIKSSRNQKPEIINIKQENNNTLLEEVNKDVLKWAEDSNKEIQELKKLEAYRREFIGNISHELKTPIFNIQGYILTLLDGGLEDKNINRRYLERAEKSIDRMISIISDLETISRLESGEMQLKIEKFEIVSLSKEIFEFLEIKAKKKNIKLQISETGMQNAYVSADKDRIRQVLSNLVDNSINYGNNNGFTKVGFYELGENILIEVTDNGIGIEQYHIPRLFERFYRTDKGRSREEGGTGLGLAIVKHILEAHNQTINVRSEPGMGSTFTFALEKGFK